MNICAILDVDIDSVKVRSLISATYYCTNMPSGRQYVFYGAGAEVDVSMEDVKVLLEKRTPTGCCGTAGRQPIFELVGD